MKLRKIVPVTILVMILIDLGSVSGVWSEVKAGRPDFFDLYRAGIAMRQASSGALQQSSTAQSSSSERIDRLHPPFEIFGFALLSRLGPITAYILWLAVNLLLLWSIPLLLWRFLPELHSDFHYVAIFYGSFLFVFVALIQGQDSILLLYLLTLGFVCVNRGRNLLAGVFLGLGLFKFFIVLPVVAAFGLRKRMKLLLGFLISATVLVVLSFSIVGVEQTVSYYLNLATFAKDPHSHAAAKANLMPTMRGLILALTEGNQSAGLVSVTGLCSIVGTLAIAIWSYRQREESLALAYPICLVGTSFFAFHFFLHNAAILLLPLLLAANQFAQAGATLRNRVLFGISVVCMYAIPNMVSAEYGSPVIALGMLGVLVALISEIRASQHTAVDMNAGLSRT